MFRITFVYDAALFTANACLKYVVVYLLFGSVPNELVVNGSRPIESPNPSGAGPANQLPSSKSLAYHAVPWSTPLSRYFQTELEATRICATAMLTGCEL